MLYADRIFLSCNGFELVDVQSFQATRNRNARAVPVMSRNKRNRGWVEGNLEIDLTVTIAIQNLVGQPAFSGIDYEVNDIQLTAEFGANQIVYTGIMLKQDGENGSGPGDEVKNTFTFGALDYTDPVGLVAGTLDIQVTT